MKKSNKPNKAKELISKYTYRAEWSEDDGVFIARALEMPSVLAHADTPEDAIKEVKVALVIALDAMIEEGDKVPEPIALHKFKGRFLVRATPELHKEISIQAAEAGVSVNQLVLTKLASR
jgi:predicted RNase H-like HicB family nuclease